MKRSENGWPVIDSSTETRRWVVPGEDRGFNLHRGNAGFLLIFLADWFDAKVERIDRGTWDEWGWAYRPIVGTSEFSNHASGTAIDINATMHPQGARNTFSRRQRRRIRRFLRRQLESAVGWGGDYRITPDDMHFEIAVSPGGVWPVTEKLKKTRRGRRIMRANGMQVPKRKNVLQGFKK